MRLRWTRILGHLTVLAALVSPMIMPAAARAADVRARIDRGRIAAGETLMLTVTVDGQAGSVDVAPIRDFEVTPRGTSTRIEIVNGTMSRAADYSFELVPLKTGKLMIPTLPVTVDDQVFHTQAIAVDVGEKGKAAWGGAAVFLRARLSESSPYESQPIVYTLQFFHSAPVTKDRFRKPSFEGFSVHPVKESRNYTVSREGREYRVVEVGFVLIPLAPGEIRIESARLEVDLLRPSGGRRRLMLDPFSNNPIFGGGRPEHRVLRSAELTARVRPLPADPGGEPPFSGLVGQFKLQAALDPMDIRAGESTTLSIRIEGSGNLMDAQAPEFETPAGCKRYADSPEEALNFGPQGVSGHKLFRYALVGIEAGSFELASIHLRIFDPKTERFATLTTSPIRLAVVPEPGGDRLDTAAPTSPETARSQPVRKRKVEFVGRDILPLKTELDALVSHHSLSPGVFALLLVLPPLFIGTIALTRRFAGRRRDPARVLSTRAHQTLEQIRRLQPSQSGLLGDLQRAIVLAVRARSGCSGVSLTATEVQRALSQAGCRGAVAEEAEEMIDRIEAVRFGAVQMEDFRQLELTDQVERLVGRILK